jgi:hypothetical protein
VKRNFSTLIQLMLTAGLTKIMIPLKDNINNDHFNLKVIALTLTVII